MRKASPVDTAGPRTTIARTRLPWRLTVPDNYSEEELLELARKYSFRSRMDRSGVTGPIFVWGRGSVVRDVNGKEYLDFNSGQMCAALGHNHPRIVQALQESAESLIHSHMTILNDREIILASRLAEITPEGMNRSLFSGSGSASNEAAMAIAKRYTGGYEVASPVVSFHGNERRGPSGDLLRLARRLWSLRSGQLSHHGAVPLPLRLLQGTERVRLHLPGHQLRAIGRPGRRAHGRRHH